MRKLLKSKSLKEISVNTLYLSGSQFLNYIIPILIIPILLKRIGYDNLGRVATYQALFIYISVFIDFGFNLIGTAEVAKLGNDKEKIQALLNKINTAKLYLAFLGVLILSPICFIIYPNNNEWIYILISLLIGGLGNVLFSEWVFHGLKLIKYHFYSLFCSKIIYFITIYLMVNNPQDYLKAIYLEALGYFTIGITSTIIIRYILDFKFKFAKYKEVKIQLKNGFYPFISNAFTTIYTTGNILILGFLSGQIEVAEFIIAQRSFFILNSVYSLANRIIYPYLSYNFSESYLTFLRIIKYYSIAILYGTVFIFFFLYLMSEQIISYLTNENSNQSIIFIFKVLCINIFFSPYNSLLTNLLIIQKRGNIIAIINFIGVILGFTMTFSLIYFYKGIGLAIGSVATNLILLLLCLKETEFIDLIFKKNNYGTIK